MLYVYLYIDIIGTFVSYFIVYFARLINKNIQIQSIRYVLDNILY